ncbi:aldo/keto reductase [Cuniculiplasma sp. SKW3]|uniref:aldo/keto reductase n=1 Tax=unclassified Cuniculiplasma TaxID=2619706 RepID=UPI003FD5E7B1
MKYRKLGKTNICVSEIGFGSWAIGGTWGKVSDADSMKALENAVKSGVNFFDTADVYGDGKSERLLSKIKAEYGDEIHIATKAGRRLNPHVPEGYNYKNLRSFIERSKSNLGVKEIELLQLHCPPWDVYYMPQVFEDLDRLREEGHILNYGVSVEKVEQAIKAAEYPGVSTVQIIFNLFRQRPAEIFLPMASTKNIGVIARVPLASGLLTGKFKGDEVFEPDDHRAFNRNGEAFDRGETFSGIDFKTGVETVQELKRIIPNGYTMTTFAIKWILEHPQVSTVITGAKTDIQIKENASAPELPDIDPNIMKEIENLYNARIRPLVHNYW